MTVQLYNQAVLSLAAYATLRRGETIDQINNLVAQQFSATQAAQFAALYPTVITSFNDSISGLQLTVFKDTLGNSGGNLTVAFRGTTIPEDLPTGADIPIGALFDHPVTDLPVQGRVAVAADQRHPPGGQGQPEKQCQPEIGPDGRQPRTATGWGRVVGHESGSSWRRR